MGDIRLTWKGKEHFIPESMAFRAADAVERIASVSDILEWRSRPIMTDMARCMAALLHVVGVRDADHEVIWREIAANYRNARPDETLAALLALASVLMDGAPEGKSKATKPEKAPAS